MAEGIEIVGRRGVCGADDGQTRSSKEAFLASFAECALLAVTHSRLDEDQRILEAEEQALRLRVQLVRDGKTGDPSQAAVGTGGSDVSPGDSR